MLKICKLREEFDKGYQYFSGHFQEDLGFLTCAKAYTIGEYILAAFSLQKTWRSTSTKGCTEEQLFIPIC